MSDGITDANAVSKLFNDIQHATLNLYDAILRAKRGHRGLTIDLHETVEEANRILRLCGYELRPLPEK